MPWASCLMMEGVNVDLSLLFTPQGLLRDSDGDGIADGIRATLIPGEGAPALAAAIELAARLGLEATGLTLPLAGTGPVEGRTPVWIEQDGPADSGMLVWTPQGMRLAGGSGPALLAAARYLATQHPEPGLPAGAKALRIGLDGRRAALVAGGWQWFGGEGGESSSRRTEGGSTDPGRLAAPRTASAHPTDLADLFQLAGGLLFPLDEDLPPELRLSLVDLAARVGVEATALSFPVTALADEALPSGLPVRVQAGPAAIRLTEEALLITGAGALAFVAQTPDLGALQRCRPPVEPPPEAEVQTWTWTDEGEVARFWTTWREAVEPGLSPERPVQVDLRLQEPRAIRAQIRAELLALLPSGSSVRVATPFKQGYHWIEEELLEQLRPLTAIQRVVLQFRRFQPQAEPALELPIRWLQECYPCDLLLERELGLPLESIAFEMVETGPTYRLIAFGPEGAPLLDESYEAITGCRQYLDAFPERGWVHPPIGSLQVDGNRWLLPTDLGRFWDWFQATVLPTLRTSIIDQHGAEPPLTAQPLFGRLEVALTGSEEERFLQLREESVSPLEALHEDLYFVTLDELATWGRALHGAPFDAPGTILPFLEAKPGTTPEAKVRLTRLTAPAPARPVEPIRVIELGPEGRIAWGVEAATYTWRLSQAPAHSAIRTPAELRLAQTEPAPVPLDRLIEPTNLEGHLAHIARLPGVEVWQAGESYSGRPLWAVAYRPPTGEALRPSRKAAAFRPTLLVNARHHANEVSSTNAILATIEAAANGDPELQQVNLVAIPYENADGAATHWAMAQQNPAWKHHAARFNAVGLEFYGEYAKPETPYTEARVLA
ncbi:MAG TPA: M14 family zinc carboxypeptidase, partial [Symbiobacteriaceae bacterium]|nr:M14 family zinc carboxypeptidase [Symbiobacteriaceae bacterium]